MAILEQVREKPDWMNALAVALLRPRGVPERRSGEDPWNPDPRIKRPRRITDDLAWFRRAIDAPDDHGLRPVDDEIGLAWEGDDDARRHLTRLRDRGVLSAAGFALHERDRPRALS